MELKILSKTKVSNNGCWLWQGGKNSAGYGTIKNNKKNYYVHRVMLFGVASYSNALQANHKCRNRSCLNPDHLYAGTSSQNALDAVLDGTHHNAKKTDCLKGHKLIPENIYKNAKGNRSCKACSKIRSRRQHANKGK